MAITDFPDDDDGVNDLNDDIDTLNCFNFVFPNLFTSLLLLLLLLSPTDITMLSPTTAWLTFVLGTTEKR